VGTTTTSLDINDFSKPFTPLYRNPFYGVAAFAIDFNRYFENNPRREFGGGLLWGDILL